MNSQPKRIDLLWFLLFPAPAHVLLRDRRANAFLGDRPIEQTRMAMLMFAGAALTALDVLTELTNVKAPARSPAENAAAFGLAEPSSNETMAAGAGAPAAPPPLSAETMSSLLALLGEQGAKHDLTRDRIAMPDREGADEAGSAAANDARQYGARSFERQPQMLAPDPGRSFVVTV